MNFTYRTSNRDVTIKLATNSLGFLTNVNLETNVADIKSLSDLIKSKRGMFGNTVHFASHITDFDYALRQIFQAELVLPNKPLPKPPRLPLGSLP